MRRLRRLGAVLVAGGALAAGPSLVAGCAPPPAAPPAAVADRWTQIFRDDFDGAAGAGPSAANWRFDLGTCYPGCPAPRWGTDEVTQMTKAAANVALDGSGHLAITPVLRNGVWTSGRIESVRSDFAPPPGGTLRVEGLLRLPDVDPGTGAGYWPAFWMMGAPIRDSGYTIWPVGGEVDIMEQVNGRPVITSALHAGPTGKPVYVASAGRACPACDKGYHVYAVELDDAEARFYLDGVQHHQVTRTQFSEQTWQAATRHRGFFLILNVAIGGNLPKEHGGGPNSSTVSGRPMLVDHVAVYTRARPAG